MRVSEYDSIDESDYSIDEYEGGEFSAREYIGADRYMDNIEEVKDALIDPFIMATDNENLSFFWKGLEVSLGQ